MSEITKKVISKSNLRNVLLRNRKKENAHRRFWSRAETRTLLVFAIHRKNEFTQIIKRKTAHSNLLEDKTSSGVADVSYTEEEIKNKIRSVKKAYKSCLDNNAMTGTHPGVEPYKDLLEQLFEEETSVELSEHKTIASVVGVSIACRSKVKKIQETPLQNATVTEQSVVKSKICSTSAPTFEDIIEISADEEDIPKTKLSRL